MGPLTCDHEGRNESTRVQDLGFRNLGWKGVKGVEKSLKMVEK